MGGMAPSQNRDVNSGVQNRDSGTTSSQNREMNIQNRDLSLGMTPQNREMNSGAQNRDVNSMMSTSQNRDMSGIHNRDLSSGMTPSRDSNAGMVTPKRPVRESNYSSPKTVSGVKMRNRARDDLALCSANQTSKVKRHASVMLYR